MKKICYDRVLPENLSLSRRTIKRPGIFTTRLIAPLHRQWINGTSLRVRFMGGTLDQHEIVKQEAKWWERCANIHFLFNEHPQAEIRITFDENDGAWSYIGTECASIPLDQPTMNLGFLDPGTAAHEFGHAIGLAHEHQNPEGGIQWNVPVVMRDLKGPPNYWDEETIRYNVLEKYEQDQIKGTQFDPASIMCYAFPEEWTLNHVKTGWNTTLSDMDKNFIGSSSMYPIPVAPPEPPTVPNEPDVTKPTPPTPPSKSKKLTLNHARRTMATIRKPGEEDVFYFDADKPASYKIDTRGNTNVAMRLFGPDSLTHLVAEDDDSGIDENAMIVLNLQPGRYFVQIRHSDIANGTGHYTVKAFQHPLK